MAEHDFELEQMINDIDPSFEGDKEAFARELLERKKWEQNNPRIQAHVRRTRMEAGTTYSSPSVENPQSNAPAEDEEAPAPEMQSTKRGKVRKGEMPSFSDDRSDQVPKVEGFDQNQKGSDSR